VLRQIEQRAMATLGGITSTWELLGLPTHALLSSLDIRVLPKVRM